MTKPAETLPAATVAAEDPFGAARAKFEAEIAFLESEDAANLDHAALEDRLIESNRRVYLLLCQGYFDQRAAREQRVTVVDAEGVDRPYCEPGHRRRLMVIFGDATVDRFAYRRQGGELEAEEVREAITWLGRRTEGALAVIGVSEGAMATLAAARSGVPIAAFVADSGFLDGRAVLARGFSSSLHLPRFLFRLVPQLFPLWSGGHRPLNLSAEDLQSWHTPTLVIQGENDRVVPPAVGRRLAELTKGQLWTVADASHAGALGQDADRYASRVIEFLAGVSAVTELRD
ncbi:MAG: hypothetical protein CYG61_11000 [Actinobacteria bacterium]|nr:MAG: hypothetical protein CYG61_11000 [Actinomycetota bacterium]